MDVFFHLPNFTKHYYLNRIFIKLISEYPEYFREGVKIASVYGEFPPSLWNGGRCSYGESDKSYIKEVLKGFNDVGIPCRFTYTNPLLTEKHTSDQFCNMCMNLANNGLNEVIVVSPILEKYIRRNYPNFKITSSTCKRIRNMDALNEELEKDYNLVVLDYNWNNQFEELEKIKLKDKCEILINPVCVPNCERRGEHYRFLGQWQIDYCDHMRKRSSIPFEHEHFECEHMDKNIYDIKEFSTHIKPDDIFEKYVPMGFNNFKIEGRTSHMLNLIDTYLYYMAKPEYRDITRFVLLLSLEHNEVIKLS